MVAIALYATIRGVGLSGDYENPNAKPETGMAGQLSSDWLLCDSGFHRPMVLGPRWSGFQFLEFAAALMAFR